MERESVLDLLDEHTELYGSTLRAPDEQRLPETDVYSLLGSLRLEADTVLAEHQQEAFNATVDFYANDGKECYLKSPTASGKTVYFVTLAQKLIAAAPEGQPKPRVMVLEPTQDLVDQTVGSVDEVTGKRRGFIGFAPDLKPGHSTVF
ncbi:MAG: DEAD/DEAH box helicase family protein [Candidatus Saccharibacteria bacterium]